VPGLWPGVSADHPIAPVVSSPPADEGLPGPIPEGPAPQRRNGSGNVRVHVQLLGSPRSPLDSGTSPKGPPEGLGQRITAECGIRSGKILPTLWRGLETLGVLGPGSPAFRTRPGPRAPARPMDPGIGPPGAAEGRPGGLPLPKGGSSHACGRQSLRFLERRAAGGGTSRLPGAPGRLDTGPRPLGGPGPGSSEFQSPGLRCPRPGTRPMEGGQASLCPGVAEPGGVIRPSLFGKEDLGPPGRPPRNPPRGPGPPSPSKARRPAVVPRLGVRRRSLVRVVGQGRWRRRSGLGRKSKVWDGEGRFTATFRLHPRTDPSWI